MSASENYSKEDKAQIEREIAELRASYKYAITMLNEVEAKMPAVRATLVAMKSGTYTATSGSHVGWSQCAMSYDSAIRHCDAAQSALAGTTGGGVSAPLRGGSAGSTCGGKMIKVSPAIAKAAKKLEEQAKQVIKYKMLIEQTAEGITSESDDLAVFKSKAPELAAHLSKTAGGMAAMANNLSQIYNSYQKAQEEAIHRAMLIPR